MTRRCPCRASWAVENFAISGQRLSTQPDPIVALAAIKEAAALANMELGVLERTLGDAIVVACPQCATMVTPSC
ncbi:MAG: hypothetical protein AB7E55_11210 [Pigmentiphaga sp.]